MLFEYDTNDKNTNIHFILAIDRRTSTINNNTYELIFKKLYILSNDLNRNISVFIFDTEIKEHWINITPFQFMEYCLKFLNKVPVENSKEIETFDVINYISDEIINMFEVNEYRKKCSLYNKFSQLQIDKIVGLFITDNQGLNIVENKQKAKMINDKFKILSLIGCDIKFIRFNTYNSDYNQYNLVKNLNIRRDQIINVNNEVSKYTTFNSNFNVYYMYSFISKKIFNLF